MRKLVTLTTVITILFFGNIATAGTAGDNALPQDEIPKVSINDFNENAEKYVDQKIRLEGMVVHVCKHGGKRMFIIGDNPDERVKITKGENMASFKPEMEGSDVVVEGIVHVQRVDEAYLDQWEKDVKANLKESDKKIHTGEEGHEEKEGEMKESLNKIKNMRNQLQQSDEKVLSFYSIECTDYQKED